LTLVIHHHAPVVEGQLALKRLFMAEAYRQRPVSFAVYAGTATHVRFTHVGYQPKNVPPAAFT
jgi:hypothetical protein